MENDFLLLFFTIEVSMDENDPLTITPSRKEFEAPRQI
jgi:hypothetical protein